MARRKPVKKKEEPGLTARQFTRREMLKKLGLTGKVSNVTIKQLIQKESMWDPRAVSSTNDFGLCQMNFYVFDSMWTKKYHHNPVYKLH